MPPIWVLDERLEQDSFWLGTRDDVQFRLMKDARYAWLVLIPQVPGAEDWHDLTQPMQSHLFALSMQASKVVKQALRADKMNVANLGNMVRQLHVHVVARHVTDAAWPNPVWGLGEATAHAEPEKSIQEMRDLLEL